jgi:predicted RNA-binding protein YlxR (DUF448 family)
VSEPVRRCVGCGRTAPQRELLRFVAREGTLRQDAKAAGRGAYTCRRLGCFERAVAQRGFNRTLRMNIQVDPALARLYTERLNG